MGAFAGTSLTSMRFGADVHLDEMCLSGMDKLQTIEFYLGYRPSNIGLDACPSLKTVYVKSAHYKIKIWYTLSHCKASTILIDDCGKNIKHIASNAFAGCSNLSSLDLSKSSIDIIPHNAFNGCSSLSSIYLSQSTTAFAENAFEECYSLNTCSGFDYKNIKDCSRIGSFSPFYAYNLDHSFNTIGPSAFYNLVIASGESSEPQTSLALSTNSIGQGSFQNALSIYSMQLSTSQNTIPDRCFYGCLSTKSISVLNDTLDNIEQYAFADCSELTSVYFNSFNISSVGDYAFYRCGKLRNISFASNALSIGSHAFEGCNSLLSILFDDVNHMQFGEDSFKDCNNVEVVQVNEIPSSMHMPRLDSAKTVFINKSISTLSNCCPGVDLHDLHSVQQAYISLMHAFFGESCNLTSIEFKFTDNTLIYNNTIIDYQCLKYADDAKTTLQSVLVNEDDICSFLSSGVIPSNVRSLCANAYDDVKYSIKCIKALTTIDLNRISCIGDGALSSLPCLNSVVANDLQNVPDAAFADDLALSNVQFKCASSIGVSAFYNCKSLAETSFRSISVIGDYAFCNCTSLSNIALEDASHGLVVPATMLSGCYAMKKIDLCGIKDIAVNAFEDCNNNLSVYFVDKSLQQLLAMKNLAKTSMTVMQKSLFGQMPIGSKIFTNDNMHSSPTMIALSDGNMWIASDLQLVIDFIDGRLCLVGVDQKIEHSNDVFIEYCSQMPTVMSTAFNNAKCIHDVHFGCTFTSAADIVQDDAFSAQNAKSIEKLYFLGDCPSVYEWQKFFEEKLSGNDIIRVYFDDGYAQGDMVYSVNTIKQKHLLAASRGMLRGTSQSDDVDIFIPINKSGAIYIGGVHEQLAQSQLEDGVVKEISSSYVGIAQNAFTDTYAISRIDNFGNISCIEDYAFRYNSSISSMVISTSSSNPILCSHAFSDCTIREVSVDLQMANGTNAISGYGLNDTVMLRRISYLSSVQHIAPSAMINCRSLLASVDFSDEIVDIGNAAFAEFIEPFARIEDINLHKCKKLSSIGDYAFYNALQKTSLENNALSVPQSLKHIGVAAFAYDRLSWTQKIHSFSQQNDNGLLDIAPSAFTYSYLREVELPESLSVISSYAFAYPKYQFPLHIKSKIAHIGTNAFYQNVIVNPSNIKKNIVSIDVDLSAISSIFGIYINDEYTADNVAGFTDATVLSATAQNNNPYKSFVYILDNKMNFCPQNLSIDLVNQTLIRADLSSTSAFVPQYLTCIGPSAFAECTSLTSVSAHEPISVGQYAFYNCISLKTIQGGTAQNIFNIYNDVNECQFYNCSSLVGLNLMSSVASIGASAFYNCDGISSFHNEDILQVKNDWALSSIDDNAFENCSSLSVFDIPPALLYLGNDVFKDCGALSNINIDMNAQEFADRIGKEQISDAVSCKFNSINSTGNTRINFLDVTYMNDGTIKIDNEFIKVRTYSSGSQQLSAISALEYAKFYEAPQQYLNLSAISQIDDFVFNSISKLRSINILPFKGADVSIQLDQIGDYAFNNCSELMSINGGLLECSKIGCYAFANCSKLIKLQLSYSALTSTGKKAIEQGAFYGTSLNQLTIVGCPPNENEWSTVEENVKIAIGWDETNNKNPLELPDYCVIVFIDTNNKIIGKYDCMMNDILHASIDINRNALTFIDKNRGSIRPLLLVKPVNGKIPAIASNTFHANIIGRWK